MATTRGKTLLRLGDPVRIVLGRRKLTGAIVEDRGAIGIGGRRLFQVSIPMDPDDPMVVEAPEDELEPLPEAERVVEPLDRAKVVEYLSNGGLLSILFANLSGGRSQPAVWLCRDQLGNVTHTFVPERGLVGGRVAPFRAIHDDRVFTPKRDQVVTFVESFGLDRAEAEHVVEEVGTSP